MASPPPFYPLTSTLMTNNTSSKQLAANRENAKLGGVKTEKGKSTVRFNARKHGIVSTLLTDYEEKDLKEYLEQVRSFYDPQNCVEELLVERIAICYLRLNRAAKAEADYIRTKLEPHIVEDFIRSLDTVIQEGYKATMLPEDVEHLGNTYLRYETGIENRLYKAMHELERLQRMRQGEHVYAPVTVDVQHENGFVSQNDQ